MTNEEASFILANIDRREFDDELNDALDMAIKALEHEQALGEAFNIAFLYGKEKGIEAIDKALYQMGMDGIKEQEIKALEQESYKVSEYDKDHIWYKGRQYISLRRFLEVKKALEQEPKTGHWIPVSERLPEKDDLYLICFDDGEYELVYFCKGDFSYSGVIAWMPLPEPYKADKENKE